ncbi:MAG: inorganic diphosphatase [Bacteroidetes bacterium]|nr:inorganic diphosphatase [Bacteroidota bacterium]
MKLPQAFTKNNEVNVIIETPFKSRNKFTYDEASGLFKLKKAIPDGLAFPCDFGFIPNTKGADGDPLDVVLLIEDYTFPGCLVECRIIGVIKLEEKKPRAKKIRNDRFIAVPAETKDDSDIQHVNDLNKNKLKSITEFLSIYNYANKEIQIKGIAGPAQALNLIKKQVI